MMVTRVQWTPFRIPFVTPYETARGRASHRTGYIVRVHTQSGFSGLGEASLDPSEADSQDEFPGRIRSLARALLRLGPNDDPEPVMQRALDGDMMARAVHCAFETALLDAGGRELGISAAEMMTGDPDGPLPIGPARTSVPVNATIAHRESLLAVSAALSAKQARFGCIKLKVGMESSPASEASRVRAVRDAIGPDIRLRLDANGAWDRATAIVTIQALEPYDIELVEQPVPARDLNGLRAVADAIDTPIAADESADNRDSAMKALDYADLLVLKPMRLGGSTSARFFIDLAQVFENPAIVTTTIDTGIATAMALHTVAALEEDGIAHGLATTRLLEHDLLTQSLRIEAGRMYLPDAPGLGVELDEAAAARYLGDWQEVQRL